VSWNGVEILEREDGATGSAILIAIHSERLGPATGGTRMKAYPDRGAARRDAMRLSEGMTYKWAAAGFPRGGGKAVLAVPSDLDAADRTALLRRYGAFIKELGGRFWTGADVGTSAEDMDVIAEEGAPYVFSRTPAKGGAGGSGTWTAIGVASSIEAACERLFGSRSIGGRSIVIQGAGSVGIPLIDLLAAGGARIAFGDPSPEAGRGLGPVIERIAPEDVFDRPCDVFAPCALGGVLNSETILRLACRAVVGSANNQLAAAEDADRLAARGILYAPDFIANAGGAIAITGIEALGWTRESAEREVRAIGDTVARVFDIAEKARITPDAAARRLAEERLAAGPSGLSGSPR
jgi:glutamate dehydrogenase/leucine dehydrogenase